MSESAALPPVRVNARRGWRVTAPPSELEGPLAAFVDASPDAVFSTTLDGTITSWNPAAARLFGFTAQEAIGQPSAILVPRDRLDEDLALLQRAGRDEAIAPAQVTRQAKGGTPLDLELLMAPVRGAGGAIVGTLQIARDMTQRRQEGAARARLAAIVDSSDDAIISKTLNGIVTSWNRGAEATFGYTAAEMVGQSIVLIIPPERRAEEDHVLARISRGESVDHFETVRLRKDGARINISLTVSPVRDDTGRVVGASKIARDITLRHRIEEQRAALYEETRKANRAKDEFLAMLGHELRNPLNAITSAVQLLGRPTADPRNAESLAHDVISRQARHLARLVDDLLDVGRVMTGKILLDPQPLDLAGAVTLSVNGLRATGRLAHHAVTVETSPVWVDADAVRLEQIVSNLVGNALKFTPPEGEIRVTVRHDRGEGVLQVLDSGMGIAPDVLPTIFELFAQGDQTLDRAKGGLGIGLSLVKRLVELHGGSVQAASEGSGRGSQFTVRLRAIPAPASAHPGEAGEARAATTSPRKILLVEDGDDARQMMRLLLEQFGHEVHDEADGLRGIESAIRLNPDAAIVDIGLPGLDGYAVAMQIRQRLGRGVLLVALTGYGRAEDTERALGAGFDMYLVKPVEPTKLQNILSRGIASRRP